MKLSVRNAHTQMKVHHINIACTDIEKSSKYFCQLYGFKILGHWFPTYSKDEMRLVLILNGIVICLSKSSDIDTVDDVAYCVESVKISCDIVKDNGGQVLEQPHYLDCIQQIKVTLDNGSCNCCSSKCKNYVEKAVIKSPIGNLKHTLLNIDSYEGIFLPGFTQTCQETRSNVFIDSIDHIAMAVEFGNAIKYMTWYENCFRFSRFITSKSENDFGLVVQTDDKDSGLRIITLNKHPCSELAVQGFDVEAHNNSVKFVFGESLSQKDQITVFLKNHKGEGIQHIAFHTKSIIKDSVTWKRNGVSFVNPPNQYYDEISLTLDVLKKKDDIGIIKDIGILVDAEHIYESSTEQDRFLYQVFTHPVLDSNTFFFELVYRHNAKGFGAGNIKALWRAMNKYLQDVKE